jgi:hypothetical protein
MFAMFRLLSTLHRSGGMQRNAGLPLLSREVHDQDRMIQRGDGRAIGDEEHRRAMIVGGYCCFTASRDRRSNAGSLTGSR